MCLVPQRETRWEIEKIQGKIQGVAQLKVQIMTIMILYKNCQNSSYPLVLLTMSKLTTIWQNFRTIDSESANHRYRKIPNDRKKHID